MTASTVHTSSTASHNPTQSNTQESGSDHVGSSHASSTSAHPQKKSHRRGSSLPALRHLEDFANGRSDPASEDGDADDDDQDLVDTPHDSSDLDEFVQGFCDSKCLRYL
ncbi:hypothetical protein DFQ26_000682 [Actinomortierella ambigua]|nr:hypothetical protein DFQ26_000682 [Actinomortierella ambigua]